MVIDGKAIAEGVYGELRERVRALGRAPILSIITCAPNFETQKYLSLKKKKAAEVGIQAQVIELPDTSTTEDFLQAIGGAVSSSDGVIVQLPLPSTVDVGRVIAGVPISHDVDALSPEGGEVLSPVVLAIREILRTHGIDVHNRPVAVLGQGKLVGRPAAEWLRRAGALVTVVTRETENVSDVTSGADIIVSGIGVPGFLTPDMVREGTIILDAGTSEEGGELRGDADPACAEKAALFTPVPGGIGPITIAMLLSNVVDCAAKKQAVL